MKKYLLIGGALLLVGVLAWGLRPQPVAVDLAAVRSGPMQVTVNEEGKTRIRERYTVVAPLTGQMKRVELKPGDPVVQGQTVLTVIEPTDPALLDARAVVTAKARVNSAQASKEQTAQLLDKAKVALDFAENELRRTRAAFESRGASDQELKEAEMTFRTRQVELKAATFAEQIARFELEQAEAALLQVSPGSTQGTEAPRLAVPSPISGVVLGVARESAGVINAGSPLVELGDPKDLEIVVQVLSRDAVKIRPGAEALLVQWGGDQPLRARVRRVEPAGFTKISALGVEEQRVNVLLDFIDPFEVRSSLGDGFRVEARVVVWSADNVLKVPAGALFRHNGEYAAYVVESGVARLRPLKIGHVNALEAEVREGLAEGDSVVLHPGDRVRDGVKVVPRQP
jgi:HlyD family secretion protein